MLLRYKREKLREAFLKHPARLLIKPREYQYSGNTTLLSLLFEALNPIKQLSDEIQA